VVASVVAVHTDGGAHGVAAVEEVVAGLRRVGSADAAAAVDAVVPVEVVVGRGAVPAAVVGLQGLVGPAIARVLSPHHDPLAGEAQGPDLRRADVVDALLHDVGRLGRPDLGPGQQ